MLFLHIQIRQKGAIDVQDDYNRFIRRSMKQAQCNYEDIFAADASEYSVTMTEAETDTNHSCGCNGVMGDSETTDSCGCKMQCKPMCENNLPVMAFVEMQPFGRMYNEAEALCRGTLFPALDKPFTGRGGCCR